MRHPWSRLISGFRNKYHEHCNGSRTCMRDLYGIEINTRTDKLLTLDELLFYFLSIPRHEVNEHFRPATDMCEIGDIAYDVVVDLEDRQTIKHIQDRLVGFYVAAD